MIRGPVNRDEATATFFDSAARGELLLQRCPDGHRSSPQSRRCEVCRSPALEPVPASGSASLVSWAVVHDRDGTQSIAAIVELEEGPWWWTMIVDVDPADLFEGQPMRVTFERPEASETVPVFRPT